MPLAVLARPAVIGADVPAPPVPAPHLTVVRPDAGTRDAEFRAFYETLYPRLARYCYRLVRNEELARDVTQESFVCLLARWFAVREPEAYLFHVATNLVRTTARRAKRETEAMAAVGATLVPTREDHGHAALRIAVERLPQRYRELVLLYYFADLPLSTVAAAVRRPEGTVKRQMAEARTLLATALGEPRALAG